MGYRTAETANPAGKLTSLKEVRELISSGELASFGEVAGYPKLPPGFWDGPDFCVLVALLIVKGKTGADPAWLNFVHDKSRLTVATTESGYINTKIHEAQVRVVQEVQGAGALPIRPEADNTQRRLARVERERGDECGDGVGGPVIPRRSARPLDPHSAITRPDGRTNPTLQAH